MASPGITPIQLIAVTNPCLCGYLAEADGALLDAIARPEEASRTLLIRAADRLHLSAARQSPLLRVARTPATSTAPPSSPGLMLPALGWRAGATILAVAVRAGYDGSHFDR